MAVAKTSTVTLEFGMTVVRSLFEFVLAAVISDVAQRQSTSLDPEWIRSQAAGPPSTYCSKNAFVRRRKVAE